jgi:asparagine synthase (glutamine-hydrolysing)
MDLQLLTGLMAETLVHRGPDDGGVWLAADDCAALSHRRLSIVDLSPLGRNPMLWDGGRLAITFNGEIYNYRELRRELQIDGYHFRTETDTEVILAAYDKWGVDAVTRFVGMFAFGLWDAPRRRLWLVRDRLGKKPLYYTDYGGTLRFASELKAIVGDETFPRTVDRTALQLYLRYGYVPAPFSIYQHIRKLEPAHYLLCERGGCSSTRYWDPLAHLPGRAPAVSSDADAEAQLERLLGTAVEQRMIADVPLGAFLSGGIDSSLVVALMQERSRERAQTFTIRFDRPEFNEADHAAAVARHLGTEHHEETCTDAQMLAAVERVSDVFDEPFADSSAIPTYLLSKAARDHVTVALSGDGGDELFFGYPRYRYYADGAWVFALPAAMRRVAAAAARRMPTRRLQRISDVLRGSDSDLYGRFLSYHIPVEVAALTHQPVAEAPIFKAMLTNVSGLSPSVQAPLLDLVSYLPDDILTKVDRASMAVSLEVRAPLLDHRVVEFAIGLPLHLKRRRNTMKWLLRRLLYKRVPRALVDRPKMGFGVPLSDWFLGPLRETMDEYCKGDALEQVGLDPLPVRRMWREFQGGRRHRPDLLWQMFMLAAWSRRFLGARSA